MKSGVLDPKERAVAKQRAREADHRALAAGNKSRDELRRENGHFGYAPERVIVHYERAKKLS
jgi:hypothetical protein